LNAHPDVLCTENRLFGDYFDVVHDEASSVPRLRITMDRYVDAIMQHCNWQSMQQDRSDARDAIVAALARELNNALNGKAGKSIVVDKITPYVDTANAVGMAISRLFPDARIIKLVRDGRDVLTSSVFHWLNKRRDDETEDEICEKRRLRFAQGRSNVEVERFFCDDEIRRVAREWTQPIDACLDLEKRHSMLAITYEEMIDDTSAALARILGFLGVKLGAATRDSCVSASSFETMSGGRCRGDAIPTAHVRKGVVGDWRNYFTRLDGELFDELAGKTLLQERYEPNTEWIESLPEKLAS